MPTEDMEVKITEKNHVRFGREGKVIFKGIIKDEFYLWVNIDGLITRVSYKSVEIISSRVN